MADNRFVDVWLIYPSAEDEGMWVAHSINTDQIALGHCKLAAYVALKHVVKALLDAADADPSIEVLSPAPQEVRDMLKIAKKMPQELLDRAEELLARNAQSQDKDDDDSPFQSPPVDLGLIQNAT
jgi:hypothetical protein